MKKFLKYFWLNSNHLSLFSIAVVIACLIIGRDAYPMIYIICGITLVNIVGTLINYRKYKKTNPPQY